MITLDVVCNKILAPWFAWSRKWLRIWWRICRHWKVGYYFIWISSDSNLGVCSIHFGIQYPAVDDLMYRYRAFCPAAFHWEWIKGNEDRAEHRKRSFQLQYSSSATLSSDSSNADSTAHIQMSSISSVGDIHFSILCAINKSIKKSRQVHTEHQHLNSCIPNSPQDVRPFVALSLVSQGAVSFNEVPEPINYLKGLALTSRSIRAQDQLIVLEHRRSRTNLPSPIEPLQRFWLVDNWIYTYILALDNETAG
jgi:hypothetical protein